jgi:hypothetical protein
MIAWHNVLLVLAVGFLGVGLWVLRGRAVRVRLGSREDVLARACRGGYRLTDATELAELGAAFDNRLLLVDTRSKEAYQDGHLQGALSFPLAPTWWARRSCRAVLAALLGPDKQRLVVFY